MNVFSKHVAGQGSVQEAPIIPWRPSLMDLPNEILAYIMEFLGVDAIKVLREVNRRLLAASRCSNTRHFKLWSWRKMSAKQIRQFTAQVITIKGFQVDLLREDSSVADNSLKILARRRPELECVDIRESLCTDKTLRVLIHHHNIKVVRLCGSNVTGERLVSPSITNGSVIQVLDLSRCEKLTDKGLLCLLNKTGGTLKVLNISGTNLSLSNVESVKSRLSLLEVLNMQMCSNVSESGVIALLNKIGTTLKSLDLSWTEVTFSELGSLTTDLPVLECLKLRSCKNLIHSGAIDLLNKTGTTLKFLSLSSSKVSSSELESLTTHFPVMETLHLDYCPNLTDSGAMKFLKQAGGTLRILSIRDTKLSFTDSEYFTLGFPVLEYLNLVGCKDLSEDGLVAFLKEISSGNLNIYLSHTSVDQEKIRDLFPHIHVG